MVESAKMRECDDVAGTRWMNGPWLRALLGQRQMSSGRMIVGHVGTKHAAQMVLAENDVVVEAVSSNRSDQPLNVGILPG